LDTTEFTGVQSIGDAVKTEDKVNHSQPIKHFGQCDDGKVAEEFGYAESPARLRLGSS